MNGWSLSFSPALPLGALAALGAAALVLAGVGLVFRARGALMRAVVGLCLLLGLAGPSLVHENRRPLKDVVAVVVDHSASNRLEKRAEQTEAAKTQVLAKLAALDNVEVRVVDSPQDDPDNRGTLLFAELKKALGDTPPERVGAAIFITDGLVHDIPAPAALGFNAPVHALITGHDGERDRRVELLEAPKFGIVGKDVTIKARIDDTKDDGAPIEVVVKRDGAEVARYSPRVGETLNIPAPVDHAGDNVFEIGVTPLPGELTDRNNRVVATVSGVRDKLRVLLVSGEPHPGERMWRNMLKADGNVDLVHFTILRSPDKTVDAPINELSLIAFPVDDIFGRRIKDFDLIILDRYSRQSVVAERYLANIVDYVKTGGALLIEAGPEFLTADGLSNTELGTIAPARPNGEEYDGPFRAQISPIGRRHPVTRALEGDVAGGKPTWGPWFRAIGAQSSGGDTIMQDESGHPLLTLAHVDKGRVGLLLTDQMWLWARGLDGGGPHVELLRRVAHWLMKEPELAEESLSAKARGHVIEITRQSLKDGAATLRITGPDGAVRDATMPEPHDGVAQLTLPKAPDGLTKIDDGTHVALVNVGADNALELQEVVSTMEHLRPIADATGGGVVRVGAEVSTPLIVSMSPTTRYAGGGFIGIKRAGASELIGVASVPLDVGFLALAAIFGALALAWAVEGGRLTRRA